MSTLAVYIFNERGEPEEAAELRNSHGFLPMILSAMDRRYEDQLYPERQFLGPRPSWINAEKGYWDRLNAAPMRWWERVVVQLAYDNAVGKGQDFLRIADALERFEDAHAQPGYVCHLPAIAKLLREMPPTSTGVAFAGSLSDDPWFAYNEETEESEPYCLLTGTKHFFVEVPQAEPTP